MMMARGGSSCRRLLPLVLLVVLLCVEVTHGKGGTSSYSGRASTSRAYAANRGSRYMMYPAAGVLVYWGTSRRYRAHGYRDKNYNGEQAANQQGSYRYLNFTFVVPSPEVGAIKIGELRFSDSAGSLIPTGGVVVDNCADLSGCDQSSRPAHKSAVHILCAFCSI